MVYMLKSPIIAWAACGTAQWQYATSTFPITHLIRPPTPPPQNLHNLCFSFLLGITTVPSETENNTYANFFFGGGAGGSK